MAENKFMQTFDTESDVLRKIEELKAQGSSESDMYVMARDKEQISMVRGRTDVDYKSVEGNWMDKFMNFLSGDDSTRGAFTDMGVDEGEADRYYQEVQDGKILLFVDNTFEENYNRRMQTGGMVGGVADTTSGVGRDGQTVNTSDVHDISYNTDSHHPVERDETAGSRFDRRETAGVGEDTGTGFGLGSAAPLGDEPRETTNDRDFLATNRDKDLLASTENQGLFADKNAGFTEDRDFTGDEAEEERLRLHEEKLRVDKERVQTGEVNVGKHVVEEQQTVDVPVEREEVYIERRPVNEETVTGTHDFRDDNDSIHVPVSEEHVDVSKKDVVSEELVVGKRKVQDTETVSETVRREEADIEDTTNLDRKGLDDDFDRGGRKL